LHIPAALGGSSGHFDDCQDNPCIIIAHNRAAIGRLQKKFLQLVAKVPHFSVMVMRTLAPAK
jgi:hypothetical protein